MQVYSKVYVPAVGYLRQQCQDGILCAILCPPTTYLI